MLTIFGIYLKIHCVNVNFMSHYPKERKPKAKHFSKTTSGFKGSISWSHLSMASVE
jgi:hypothetical protein